MLIVDYCSKATQSHRSYTPRCRWPERCCLVLCKLPFSAPSNKPCQAPSPRSSLSSRPPVALRHSLTSCRRSLRAIASLQTQFIRVAWKKKSTDTAAMPSKFKPLTLAPINFSLTEGTSIPAPLDSPPETPRPPTPGKGPLSSHPTPKSPLFPQHRVGSPNGKASGETAAPEPPVTRGRTSDAASGGLSPTSPGSQNRRPSSVRQFLGLRTLSSKDSLQQDERPGSPATISGQPSLTRKKSSGWFGSKRKSSYFGSVPEGSESFTATPLSRTVTNSGMGTSAPVSRIPAQQTPPKKQGPPPPALPQLGSFGVNEKTLSFDADDMFKNIK